METSEERGDTLLKVLVLVTIAAMIGLLAYLWLPELMGK
jgi:type II secretory pathway component PulJ